MTPCIRCAKGTATVGLLCRTCNHRLRDALGQIPDLMAALPPVTEPPDHGDEQRTKRGKISGSPALIRLDVMVLAGWGYAGDGVAPVWETIAGWVRAISEEFSTAQPADTALTSLCSWLLGLHQRIVRAPWIDEYWTDVIGLQQALRRATNAPRPIGRCFGWDPARACNAPLYLPDPKPGQEVSIRCDECGRRYNGVDLVRLQIQAEREAG